MLNLQKKKSRINADCYLGRRGGRNSVKCQGGWASNAFEQHLIGIAMTGKSNQVNL